MKSEVVGARVESGDEERIEELFERAESGHPFGYRRDVDLLMDVICNRLSKRLCHRCLRQTTYPECPRNFPSDSESCQCDLGGSNIQDFHVGKLSEGRDEITQTTLPRLPDQLQESDVLEDSPHHGGHLTITSHKGALNPSRDTGNVISGEGESHSERVKVESYIYQYTRADFLRNRTLLDIKIRQMQSSKNQLSEKLDQTLYVPTNEKTKSTNVRNSENADDQASDSNQLSTPSEYRTACKAEYGLSGSQEISGANRLNIHPYIDKNTTSELSENLDQTLDVPSNEITKSSNVRRSENVDDHASDRNQLSIPSKNRTACKAEDGLSGSQEISGAKKLNIDPYVDKNTSGELPNDIFDGYGIERNRHPTFRESPHTTVTGMSRFVEATGSDTLSSDHQEDKFTEEETDNKFEAGTSSYPSQSPSTIDNANVSGFNSGITEEDPGSSDNFTIGAKHHKHIKSSPAELLRRRCSKFNAHNTSKGSIQSDLDLGLGRNEDQQDPSFVKQVNNWNQFDCNGIKIWKEVKRTDGNMFVRHRDANEKAGLHHYLNSVLPRAMGQRRGSCNVLVGMADSIADEVEEDGTSDLSRPDNSTEGTVGDSMTASATSTGSNEMHVDSSGSESIRGHYAKSQTENTAYESMSMGTTGSASTHNPLVDEERRTTNMVDQGIQAAISVKSAFTQTRSIIGNESSQRNESHRPPVGKARHQIEKGYRRGRPIHGVSDKNFPRMGLEDTSLADYSHLSLNAWTQTPRTFDADVLLPAYADGDLDWTSPDDETDASGIATVPKDAVQFYRRSFRRLKKKLMGQDDALSRDSNVDVGHRVGRVLSSSPLNHGHSEDIHSPFHAAPGTDGSAQPNTMHARSFQYSHPVLQGLLSRDGRDIPGQQNADEVAEGSKLTHNEKIYPWSPCVEYYDFELAAFLELHHLDVPIILRRKETKRDANGRSVRFAKNGAGTEIGDTPENKPDFSSSTQPAEDPSFRTKPKFHQGALKQFSTEPGIRRMSWREDAPITRKAKFFESAAVVAATKNQSSASKDRKMSGVVDTTTERRVSFYEGLGLKEGCPVN